MAQTPQAPRHNPHHLHREKFALGVCREGGVGGGTRGAGMGRGGEHDAIYFSPG